jgi:hypothetical protein
VQVEASRYYNEAVDKAEDPDSPAGFPRRGKLVFFEDTITGVGAGDSLENGIRAGMRHVMHKLFSEIARDREGMH